MSLTYMTHPHHGAMHAGDFGEIDRLKKFGWIEGKEPTAADIRAAKQGVRAAALKAELAELEAPAAIPTPPKPPKKRGRPAQER